MYYVHNLAAAKGGGMPSSPSPLFSRSQERIVNDRVIVAPVKNRYEELYEASRRLSAGEPLLAHPKDKDAPAE